MITNTNLIVTAKRITNGGIKQAFLEIANEDGLLSSSDKERLLFLQGQHKDRVEVVKADYAVLRKGHFEMIKTSKP